MPTLCVDFFKRYVRLSRLKHTVAELLSCNFRVQFQYIVSSTFLDQQMVDMSIQSSDLI